MRLVSEYTKVVATSFGVSDEIFCRLTVRVAGGWNVAIHISLTDVLT
jgi:hypothetical protein